MESNKEANRSKKERQAMMIRDDSDENGRGYKKYELAPVMVTDAPYLAVIGKIIDFRFFDSCWGKVFQFSPGQIC